MAKRSAVKQSIKNQGKKDKNYIPFEDNRFVYGMFLVFAVFMFLFSTYKITGDDDFFWHLATGRYIVETKSVPDHDIFGFVTNGVEWIPFEWGWDVLTYALYNIGGYNIILVLRSLLFVLIFYILFNLLRKFKVNSVIIIIVLMLLAFSIIDRLSPRPHIMTYVFFMLTLYIYTSFKYIDRNKYNKYLYFLPLIFLLWSNIHMGVLAGGLLLFVFGLSEILIYFYPRKFSSNEIKPFEKQDLIRFVSICFVCFLMLFVNPHGINTYLYAYSHTKMKMLETVNEWQNPFISQMDFGFVVLLYKIMLFSGIIILIYSYIRKDLVFALVYLAFAIYSVRAIRFTVDYEVVIAFFLAVSINYFVLKLRSVKNKGSLLNLILFHNAAKVIVSLIIIYIISQIPSNSIYEWMKYYRIFGYGVNSDFLPVQLFDFMKANDIKGKPFNHFGTGGYLVWNFPDQKNFLDSRNLNDNIFNEYNVIMTMQPGFESKLENYGIDYVLYLDPDLIRRPQELNQVIPAYLSKNPDKWKLVFWDDKSMLFLRNENKYADIISKYEYKILNPYNLMFNKTVMDKAFRDAPDKAKEELNRKYQTEPMGFLFSSILQAYPSVK